MELIPFTVENGFPDPSRVTHAINHWQSHTEIRFVQRTNQRNFVTFRRSRDQCASLVGMRGNQQFIYLTDECGFGEIVHEIGHAVGLWHEQGRKDRDDFVRIVTENIIKEYRGAFEPHISDGDDIGEYDYCSIMHYGRFDGCIRDKHTGICIGPTIEVLHPERECADNIGQRRELSTGDILGVRQMYKKILTSGPAVSSSQQGVLNVFARGTDNALWHKWFDADGWHRWESLGGYLTSEPAAVSWGRGRVDVFGRGRDHTLWHKWFDGHWSGWELRP